MEDWDIKLRLTFGEGFPGASGLMSLLTPPPLSPHAHLDGQRLDRSRHHSDWLQGGWWTSLGSSIIIIHEPRRAESARVTVLLQL